MLSSRGSMWLASSRRDQKTASCKSRPSASQTQGKKKKQKQKKILEFFYCVFNLLNRANGLIRKSSSIASEFRSVPKFLSYTRAAKNLHDIWMKLAPKSEVGGEFGRSVVMIDNTDRASIYATTYSLIQRKIKNKNKKNPSVLSKEVWQKWPRRG